MNDRNAFESRLAAAFTKYADEAPTKVDAAAMAKSVAKEADHALPRWMGSAPAVRRLGLAAILLILALVALAFAAVLAQPHHRLRAALVLVRDGDVYLAAADGSSLTRVIEDPVAQIASAGWTDDGRLLRVEAAGVAATIEVAGGHRLRRGPLEGAAAWAPDGSRYAYVRASPGGGAAAALVIVDLDAGHSTELVIRDGTGRIAAIWPGSWSPDGHRLAVDVGGGRLAVVDPDTGILFGDPLQVFAEDVAWSEDSSALVYSSGNGVWRVELATRTPVHLADGAVLAGSFANGWRNLGPSPLPAWSPDGARIAFRAAPGLAIVVRDGTGRRDIVSTPVGHFAWAVRSASIAYVALQDQDGATGELATVDVPTGVTSRRGISGVSWLDELDAPGGDIPESSWPDGPMVLMPAP